VAGAPLLSTVAVCWAGVAHRAGTGRFDTARGTLVIDGNCKAHGLDNLYVVDTSFFPAIGAGNPVLTVLANALRVGEHLLNPHGIGRLGVA
jgi:choline dehydrogenase-like flavoprotein